MSELHSRHIAWMDASMTNVMCNTHDNGNVDVVLIDFGPAQIMDAGKVADVQVLQALHCKRIYCYNCFSNERFVSLL